MEEGNNRKNKTRKVDSTDCEGTKGQAEEFFGFRSVDSEVSLQVSQRGTVLIKVVFGKINWVVESRAG